MGGRRDEIVGSPQSSNARQRGTVRLEVLVALLVLFLLLLLLPLAL